MIPGWMKWSVAAMLTPFGVLSGCAARSSPIRHIVVREARSCDDGSRDPGLGETLAHREGALLAALGGTPESVRTAGALRRAFRARDPRPLVLLYAGHGAPLKPPPQSKLCLADGQLELNELLKEVHPDVASVVLVLDGCWTADIDTRVAPPTVPAAVLSASHEPVATSRHGSALTPPLLQGLRGGDLNGDGVLDSDELLKSLEESLNREDLPGYYDATSPPPAPNLRRQAWAPLPVALVQRDIGGARVDWSRVSGPGRALVAQREQALAALELAALDAPSAYWAIYPSSRELVRPNSDRVLEFDSVESAGAFARVVRTSEGFALERWGETIKLVTLRTGHALAELRSDLLDGAVNSVEAGDWARVEDVGLGFSESSDASPRGRALWHGGKVTSPIRTVSGQLVTGNLDAIPCDESFGQCFWVK